MKMTDCFGAMLLTPVRAIALANAFELSSTFQPVRSTACVPVLVTSNQSAAYGLLPLLHGETSEMISDAGAAAAVTVSVSGALVASGVVPALGSSTATATL